MSAPVQHILTEYELGRMTDEEFRDTLRKEFDVSISNGEFDAAWNAMLLDIPVIREKILKILRPHHRLLLFSNTNGIHMNRVNEVLRSGFAAEKLDDYFDTAYYSYVLGMRKPWPEAFEEILRREEISAGEVLFLDDNTDNITAASSIGIKTVRVREGQNMEDVFAFYLER